MIAEIHNKISRSGSNLSDRLEDQLTGDFFGSIRYLPFHIGLKHVLDAVRFQKADQASGRNWRKLLGSIQDYDYQMHFWFRHTEGEIDLIMEHSDVVIGIEVKYYSGLSSDDEDTEEIVTPEESCHQLARYSRLLEDIRQGRQAYLIFLAPNNILTPVEAGIMGRSIISPNISLGFLAWQNVLEQLKSIELTQLDAGQRMIIQDLSDLLVRKGFERFKGFLSGTQNVSVHDNAYLFKGKSHNQRALNWPINVFVQEDSYVFNK
ncbi:hypothetical protein [Paenibacillus mesophilus]|uniref:hypothetical protein n=1 Tax=Paenibacillus mesophilus TaxID=2582849 RepID=UPI00192E417D|nr:hypothetical protein [Paenibacillus mesophilus]